MYVRIISRASWYLELNDIELFDMRTESRYDHLYVKLDYQKSKNRMHFTILYNFRNRGTFLFQQFQIMWKFDIFLEKICFGNSSIPRQKILK